jgi:hypothetical protein
VDQQVAQLEHRVVEVVAEHRFAQVLDEDATDRAAIVEHAAIVAGTGPELVAFLGIVDQGAEERRLQRLGILLQPADEVPGDELGRLLGEEDVAVDVVHHLDRDVLEPLAAYQDDDRQLQPALAHQVDQRRGLALQPLLAPVDHHAADGAVGLHGDLGILDAPRAHHLEAQPLDGARDLVEAMAFEVVGVERGCGDQDGEASEEVHEVPSLERGPPGPHHEQARM